MSTDVPGGPQGSLPTAQNQDDKTMALLAHLLGIFTSVFGPLIIWLMKKDQSPFVDDQGKEALNFQITLLIGWVVAFVLSFVVIGMILYPILGVANIVFPIMGAIKANEGAAYRYPFSIRLIK